MPPFELDIPHPSLSRSWRVKIRENERNEHPHVSIICRDGKVYRYGLRSHAFLDRDPDPRHVPEEIVQVIEQNLAVLVIQWDLKYPENPISSIQEDDG